MMRWTQHVTPLNVQAKEYVKNKAESLQGADEDAAQVLGPLPGDRPDRC